MQAVTCDLRPSPSLSFPLPRGREARCTLRCVSDAVLAVATKPWLWLTLAAVAAWTPAGAAPLEVGFVYVSPISDAGWTHQHDVGRRALQAALAGQVTTKYVENVPEGPEAERVIRQLAQDGCGLIFTTSFGYMNPTIKVARNFPQVVFEHATGYKRARNVATYNARFYEGRYLAGMIAGAMTKAAVAGYVAAFPIPEVVMGINAFTRGMRRMNPRARTRVVWVNAWYDPGREREAAAALIAQGADVLTHHTDSTAVVQTAEEKGVWAIAYHSDMSKYGPHAQLAAVTHHWGDYYVQEAKAVIAGTWRPHDVWGGLAQGMVKLEAVSAAVPADVVTQVRKVEAAIEAGSFHPFQGPVTDQAGKVRVPAGTTISDDDLARMDYYVEGVQGTLPH